MAELEVQGLSKSFGSRMVLRDVGLAVPSGRLVAILGPSGSGKTTLLRLICGFERADAGVVSIGGNYVCKPGRHQPPERRHIGYVAQEGALFPHLSVADNITFGLPRRERRLRHRVGELLDLLGLPASYADRTPDTLSGGEQQRVAVARALAPEPSLVLLDEPFSALDAALRVDTRHAVAAALAATGATALLVTHDQTEALSMGHEVAVLREGTVVQADTPDRLYRYPIDAELAQFVGDAVLLPGVAKGGAAQCILGRLPLALPLADGPVQVMLRPEQIKLSAEMVQSGPRGRVCEVTFFGPEASVQLVLCDVPGPVVISARVPGHMSPRGGEILGISIEGDVMAYGNSPRSDCSTAATSDVGKAAKVMADG